MAKGREELYKDALGNTTRTYIFRFGFFALVFFVFVVNLIALSLSLQCNRGDGSPLVFRIASALYAFMFGFIYIFVNYFSYRIAIKRDPCNICIDKPFIFF